MIRSRSIWTLSSHATKLMVGGVISVGVALLFYVEYLSGNKYGFLGSIIWALAPSVMFAGGTLFLSVGLTRRRQAPIIWYKQHIIFQVVGYLGMAFGSLILLAVFVNIILPPLLTLCLALSGGFMIFLVIMQSLFVNQMT